MKALVVYYTRTGHTKAVGGLISKKLGCDIEELIDNRNRAGLIGMTGAVFRPKRKTTIQPVKADPGDYDLVIVGTPVWWYTCTPAVTAFFRDYGKSVRKTAFFYTCDADRRIHAFEDMEEQLGMAPVATLRIDRADKADLGKVKKIDDFLKKFR